MSKAYINAKEGSPLSISLYFSRLRLHEEALCVITLCGYICSTFLTFSTCSFNRIPRFWRLHCSGTLQWLPYDNDIPVTNWHQKEKKGNKYPPQKMCSSLTYFLQLIYIFFIFFFSGISAALRGHRFGGTPEKPRRKRHQCWRVAEMMHLKIWWWEIGSCIAAAMECSGRNSNFFFTIQLQTHQA